MSEELEVLDSIRRLHRKMTHTRADGSRYDYCSECLDYLVYPCATMSIVESLDGRETLLPEKEPK